MNFGPLETQTLKSYFLKKQELQKSLKKGLFLAKKYRKNEEKWRSIKKGRSHLEKKGAITSKILKKLWNATVCNFILCPIERQCV